VTARLYILKLWLYDLKNNHFAFLLTASSDIAGELKDLLAKSKETQ